MRIFLWEIREEQGYSLRNLEKYTGISHMHIYDIERGLVSPTLEEIEKLAGVMRISPYRLFDFRPAI
ncbi:helix-turn-helix domain-containing protein [Anaerostipes hominis (ex Lee et al. 2021)]